MSRLLVGVALLAACRSGPPPCAIDSDCPSGQRCAQSACRASCAADPDCGAGEICVAGACWEGERLPPADGAAGDPEGGDAMGDAGGDAAVAPGEAPAACITDLECPVCTTCSHLGACVAIADDERCAVIDCDGLDAVCRDYVDRTAARCAAAGVCRLANRAATCTVYTDASPNIVCAVGTECLGASYCTNGSCQAGVSSTCNACSAGLCDPQGQCVAMSVQVTRAGTDADQGLNIAGDIVAAGTCLNSGDLEVSLLTPAGTLVSRVSAFCISGTWSVRLAGAYDINPASTPPLRVTAVGDCVQDSCDYPGGSVTAVCPW